MQAHRARCRGTRGGTHCWDPAPPEWTLSGSVVAAEARDRLEPDWALLRLSAAERGRAALTHRGGTARRPPCPTRSSATVQSKGRKDETSEKHTDARTAARKASRFHAVHTCDLPSSTWD